jgi:1-acyl-sn-glycerol-3-phosphate acyltransferase
LYVIPRRVLLLGARRILAGRRALCSADMARILAAAPIPPRVEGIENVPQSGPLLITQNHYCRRGLGPWWGTSLIFTAIARRRGADPRWMVTSEWIYDDRLRSLTVTPLTHWAFGRAARVWGFLPMPPDERELARRACAVRQSLQAAKALFAGGGALGIAVEGRGEDVLIEPPAGAGRFLLRLAEGVPVLPVGLYEENGVLVARFGLPYYLATRPGAEKAAEDDRIKTEVMSAIAALLPPAARGPY